MPYENLIYEKQEPVAIITLNRPHRLNALSAGLHRDLYNAITEVSNDPSIKALIITGGDKCFCAGADIKETSSGEGRSEPAAPMRISRAGDPFTRIEHMDIPTVAAIAGVCVGGGLELALVCDLRISSSDARFGLPEVNIGIIPSGGGTQRLPRLIGATRAKDLMYTGRLIGPEEAERIGIINRVVPHESFMDEAKKLALDLAEKPPLAVRMIKSCVNVGSQMNLRDALEYETRCSAIVAQSEDMKEGFRAFVEKRKPVYKGR